MVERTVRSDYEIGPKTKKKTCEIFLYTMNCSFVFQMSQLYSTEIGRILASLLSAVGIGFLFLHYGRGIKVTSTWFVSTIVLVTVGVISYIKSGAPTLLKLILFFYAIQKVEIKAILKAYMVSLIFSGSIIALSSLMGITSLYYTGAKEAIRFGMTNPNTVPVIVFAVIVSYNLIHDQDLSYKSILVEGFITWIIYYLCRARTAAIVLFFYLVTLMINKRWNTNRVFQVINWPLQFFFPMASILTISIASLFNTGSTIWLTINNYSSGRLLAWNRYFRKYGLSVFGNKIQTNMGALDNAYIQLLIKYGLITFIVYFFFFYIISRYAYRTKNNILFLSVLATEIYCVSEFSPLQINFCPVLIYFAYLLVNNPEELKRNKVQRGTA